MPLRTIQTSGMSTSDARDTHSVSFPNEIVDHIVSNLWDNHSSLGSCSLVCRAWSTLARPYIFRNVTLSCSSETSSRLQDLENMLAATPAMSYWIRELQLSDWLTVRSLWADGPGCYLTHKLKKIYSLKLFAVSDQWHMELPGMKENIARCLAEYHTVRSLSLENCTLHPQTVTLFASCLPGLRTLSFSRHSTHWVNAPYKLTHGHPPSLTSLSIASACPSLHAILSPESVQTLQSLQLLDVRNGGDNVSFITDHVGLSLHTLRVDLPKTIYPEAGIRRVLRSWEIERMKGLRKVHCGPLNSNRVLDPTILMLFSKMGVLPIEEITLEVSFDFIGKFKPWMYKALDQVFAKPAFQHLNSVHFMYRGSQGPKKARERLEQVFPSLAVRGIKFGFSKVGRASKENSL